MTRTRLLATLGFVALAFAACGGEEEDPARSQSLTVEAFDFYFEPTALNVELGAEVTVDLSNAGEVAHSFTAPDLDVEVEAGNGEQASVTFTAPDEPGSFDFFCKYHPDDMQGTISTGGSEEPAEEQPEDDDGDDDVEIDVEET